MYKQHIIVVIPALNEELSIGKVIEALWAIQDCHQQAIVDSIIVCDNGSSDNTSAAANNAGAYVVDESERGYGSACLKALSVIDTTDIVVFIDADNAFFAEQLLALVEVIEKGSDMVIGSRELGHSDPKALTFVQRFGNRLATFLVRHIWGHHYTDLGPFRAIRWSSLQQLAMSDPRYGWTVEMQVKAVVYGLSIAEVPVDTRVRIGQSKISGTIVGSIKVRPV